MWKKNRIRFPNRYYTCKKKRSIRANYQYKNGYRLPAEK
jgi:hypothetical protein